MGLDMYVYKMPRVKDLTPQEMSAIAQIHENRVMVANGLEPWGDLKEVPGVPPEIVEDLIAAATVSYFEWDAQKHFPQSSLMIQVGYWRKANAIHQWFVDHVQDGQDDCEIHDEVTRELLEELRDLCAKVLYDPSNANRLLPTQGGFFFGGTGYDEYYFDDIRETYELCKKLLKETDFQNEMLCYCSSW